MPCRPSNRRSVDSPRSAPMGEGTDDQVRITAECYALRSGLGDPSIRDRSACCDLELLWRTPSSQLDGLESQTAQTSSLSTLAFAALMFQLPGETRAEAGEP